MVNLEKLPAISVFLTDGKYVLADGVHRLKASVRKGWKYIEVEVKEKIYQGKLM